MKGIRTKQKQAFVKTKIKTYGRSKLSSLKTGNMRVMTTYTKQKETTFPGINKVQQRIRRASFLGLPFECA